MANAGLPVAGRRQLDDAAAGQVIGEGAHEGPTDVEPGAGQLFGAAVDGNSHGHGIGLTDPRSTVRPRLARIRTELPQRPGRRKWRGTHDAQPRMPGHGASPAYSLVHVHELDSRALCCGGGRGLDHRPVNEPVAQSIGEFSPIGAIGVRGVPVNIEQRRAGGTLPRAQCVGGHGQPMVGPHRLSVGVPQRRRRAGHLPGSGRRGGCHVTTQPRHTALRMFTHSSSVAAAGQVSTSGTAHHGHSHPVIGESSSNCSGSAQSGHTHAPSSSGYQSRSSRAVQSGHVHIPNSCMWTPRQSPDPTGRPSRSGNEATITAGSGPREPAAPGPGS